MNGRVWVKECETWGCQGEEVPVKRKRGETIQLANRVYRAMYSRNFVKTHLTPCDRLPRSTTLTVTFLTFALNLLDEGPVLSVASSCGRGIRESEEEEDDMVEGG